MALQPRKSQMLGILGRALKFRKFIIVIHDIYAVNNPNHFPSACISIVPRSKPPTKENQSCCLLRLHSVHCHQFSPYLTITLNLPYVSQAANLA